MDSQIHPNSYDTKLPLNIDDDDRLPGSETAVQEKTGFTDMAPCLIRCEITLMFHQMRQAAKSTNGTAECLDGHEKALNDISQHLEHCHLQYCDLDIPIQWVSATISRIAAARVIQSVAAF